MLPSIDWLLRPHPTDPPPTASRRASRLCLLALLALCLTGIGVAIGLGLDGGFGLEVLRRHHAALLGFIAGEPVLASVIFMVVYGLAVVISVPGVAVLTVIAGFLFGWVQGTIYVLVAATLGATALFLLARSALGATLRGRAGPALQRFAEVFKANASSYVFVLNLVPVLPYAVVVTLPALCGVPFWTFVLSATCGILPGTLLLASFGSGLGEVLLQNRVVELSSFLTPQILLALAGLVALALLPVVYSAYFGRRAG